MKALVVQLQNVPVDVAVARLKAIAAQVDGAANVQWMGGDFDFFNVRITGYQALPTFWETFYPLLQNEPALVTTAFVLTGVDPDKESLEDGYHVLHARNVPGQQVYTFPKIQPVRDASRGCIGYFQFDSAAYSIAMVLKDHWDSHGGLDGDGIDDRLIPPGFYAQAESIYETDMSTDNAKAALVAAGWEERELFPE